MNIYEFHYHLLPSMFPSLAKACSSLKKHSLTTYFVSVTNNFVEQWKESIKLL